MTTEEKSVLKALIDTQIESLSLEIECLKAAVYPPRGAAPSDKVAHISFKQEQSVHIQRYDEARKRLNRLKAGYLKIDTAGYGICKECEEAIPMARLQLVPESLYCVACMQELGLG
jgi:DnaK suppressor protein